MSIFKLLMVNFLFHYADGTWPIECVDTTGVQKIEEDETKGDWISH